MFINKKNKSARKRTNKNQKNNRNLNQNNSRKNKKQQKNNNNKNSHKNKHLLYCLKKKYILDFKSYGNRKSNSIIEIISFKQSLVARISELRRCHISRESSKSNHISILFISSSPYSFSLNPTRNLSKLRILKLDKILLRNRCGNLCKKCGRII